MCPIIIAKIILLGHRHRTLLYSWTHLTSCIWFIGTIQPIFNYLTLQIHTLWGIWCTLCRLQNGGAKMEKKKQIMPPGTGQRLLYTEMNKMEKWPKKKSGIHSKNNNFGKPGGCKNRMWGWVPVHQYWNDISCELRVWRTKTETRSYLFGPEFHWQGVRMNGENKSTSEMVKISARGNRGR